MSSMDEIVDGYLDQLGLSRHTTLRPSNQDDQYSFLCDIIKCHTQTFPFCTVNHMLHFKNRCYTDLKEEEGDTNSWLSLHKMSTIDLYKRICVNRTGGYCFEHNKLVYDILEHLGYNVQLVLARVINNNFDMVRPPLTHRITLVKILSEYYIVDCAFGGDKGPTIPVPVPIITNVDEKSNNNNDSIDSSISGPIVIDEYNRSFRISYNFKNKNHPDTDTYYMQCNHKILTNDEYFTNYTFTLFNYRHCEQDCISGHFYSYNYPHAIFTSNLLVGLQKFHDDDDDCSSTTRTKEIRVLWNLSYRRHRFVLNEMMMMNVNTSNVILNTSIELLSILINDFGLVGITQEQCDVIFSILQDKNIKDIED